MSQDENNNQNFDDPLGANSPDFEEQPEYNPPRPRHASAGSWSFMDFLEGTDNNAAEADGIRYRSRSENDNAAQDANPLNYQPEFPAGDNLFAGQEGPGQVLDEQPAAPPRLTFGPQERELRRTAVNGQPPEDLTEKHVMFPQIVALCTELYKKMNNRHVLGEYTKRINEINLAPLAYLQIPTKVMGPDNRMKIKPILFNPKDDKMEKRVLKFKFEPAPLGTFPTFQKSGDFPEQGVEFNPVTTSYAAELGSYRVGVDIEIPLPQLQKCFLMQLFPPTHQMKVASVYLIKNPAERKKQMYVLPQGFFRAGRLSAEKMDTLFAKQKFSILDRHTKIFWKVYDVPTGFFYQRGKCFYLPAGTMLIREDPHLIKSLMSLSRYVDNGQVNRFLFIDPMACKMLCKTSEQLFDQFHGKPEVLSVARFHSDRLPISLDAFMRYFFLRLKPSLMARFKSHFTAVDVESIREQMEIAAFALQVKYWYGYYGPAPPYEQVKKDPLFNTSRFLNRALTRNEKKDRRKSQPIGPDGLPEPRVIPERPVSKLTIDPVEDEEEEEEDTLGGEENQNNEEQQAESSTNVPLAQADDDFMTLD